MNHQNNSRQTENIAAFRVVAASNNLNSFGLRNYVLLQRSGLAYSAARSDFSGYPTLVAGQDIDLPVRDGRVAWAQLGFELPASLEPAPAAVVREVFSRKNAARQLAHA